MPAQWVQDQASTFSSTALRPNVPLTRSFTAACWTLVADPETYSVRNACFYFIRNFLNCPSAVFTVSAFAVNLTCSHFTHLLILWDATPKLLFPLLQPFLTFWGAVIRFLRLICPSDVQSLAWKIKPSCLPDMLQHISRNTNWMFGLFLKCPLNPTRYRAADKSSHWHGSSGRIFKGYPHLKA